MPVLIVSSNEDIQILIILQYLVLDKIFQMLELINSLASILGTLLQTRIHQ